MLALLLGGGEVRVAQLRLAIAELSQQHCLLRSGIGTADMLPVGKNLKDHATTSGFEVALRESGGRPSESGAVEARVTLSENQSQYLLVAEARKGDERQTWIASAS